MQFSEDETTESQTTESQISDLDQSVVEDTSMKWIPLEDQVSFLQTHGCVIKDKADCLNILRDIGIYRLIPYLYLLQRYVINMNMVSFEWILKVYRFDEKLRKILTSCVEQIEITLKAGLVRFWVDVYGEYGYLDINSYINHDKGNDPDPDPNADDKSKVRERLEDLIERMQKQLKHYGSAILSPEEVPVWKAVEYLSFGTICSMCTYMKTSDLKSILKILYPRLSRKVFVSWFKCCTDLRNRCAHFERIYGWSFASAPDKPRFIRRSFGTTLFDYLIVLKHLYPHSENWDSVVMHPLIDLFLEYRDVIDLKVMGFSHGWMDELMWDSSNIPYDVHRMMELPVTQLDPTENLSPAL